MSSTVTEEVPMQLLALQSMNLSLLVPVASLMMPRLMKNYIESLNPRQKKALDKVMPEGGDKKFYFQITDSPTPPILVELSQPPKLSTISLQEANERHIPGISLTTSDLQLLAEGLNAETMVMLLRHLDAQGTTLLDVLRLFMPLLQLGPKQLKDMGAKLKVQLNPLLGLLSHLN